MSSCDVSFCGIYLKIYRDDTLMCVSVRRNTPSCTCPYTPGGNSRLLCSNQAWITLQAHAIIVLFVAGNANTAWVESHKDIP